MVKDDLLHKVYEVIFGQTRFALEITLTCQGNKLTKICSHQVTTGMFPYFLYISLQKHGTPRIPEQVAHNRLCARNHFSFLFSPESICFE